MFVKFLAPATLAGLVLSASLVPVGATAQQAAPAPVTDSSFIQMASSLGLLQAKLGKLAEDKGSSPSVRDFGKRMVAEYAKANEQLAAGAKQAAYPAPVMLRQHQQVYDLVRQAQPVAHRRWQGVGLGPDHLVAHLPAVFGQPDK